MLLLTEERFHYLQGFLFGFAICCLCGVDVLAGRNDRVLVTCGSSFRGVDVRRALNYKKRNENKLAKLKKKLEYLEKYISIPELG